MYIQGYSAALRSSLLTFLVTCALISCAPKPLVIGVPLGLTGLNSNVGVHGRNGIQLAAEEINASGGVRGRPLKLIIENDLDAPEGGLAAVKALEGKGAIAFVGHMSSASATLSIGYLSSRQLVLISPTVSSTDFSGLDDYFFRIIGPNNAQGAELAAEALRRGYRTASLVYNSMNPAYTLAVKEGFKKAFEAGGGKAFSPHAIDASSSYDFKALAARVVEEEPDMLLCAASAFDLSSLSQALVSMDAPVPLLGSMWARTPDLMVFGGKTVEGTILAAGGDSEGQNPELRRFVASYRERFGEEPVFSALYGYEAMQVLALAMAEARKLDGPGVKAALLARSTFPGIQGDIGFDRYGDTERPYFLFEVRAGRFVRIR
jgi:branched-chain amino acid transport system substrate-binding protein